MMKQSLGSSPYGEECAQLGHTPDYETRAQLECKAFADQIRRSFADQHQGRSPHLTLHVVGHQHDFGTYFEVQAQFADDESGWADFTWVDSNTPEEWDAVSRDVLGV